LSRARRRRRGRRRGRARERDATGRARARGWTRRARARRRIASARASWGRGGGGSRGDARWTRDAGRGRAGKAVDAVSSARGRTVGNFTRVVGTRAVRRGARGRWTAR
jgi:hypothetical protein